MGGIAPPFLKSQIRHWAPGLQQAKSGPGANAITGITKRETWPCRVSPEEGKGAAAAAASA